MSRSSTTLKELSSFILLAANIYISYRIYVLFNTDRDPIFHDFFTLFDISELIKFFAIFIFIFVIEFFMLVYISLKISPRKRLATGDLLSWRDVKREQKTQKTLQFYTKKQWQFKSEKSAVPVSKNLKLTTKKMFEHIALFGPTGSGKSATFFVPILRTVSDASFVITDPKGELFRKTYKDLLNKGILSLHLNLTDPDKGNIGYSLLKNCKTPNDVRKLSESIMGNDQWGNLSKPLLQCFLFKEWAHGRKNPSLKNVIFELLQVPQTSDELDLYFSDIEDENITMSYLKFKTALGSDGLTSSIFNTVIERTQVFEYDNLKQIEKKQLFPNEILRKRKIALFLSYPEEESVIYQPFLSSFYSQLFNQIKSEVNEFEEGNKGYPVYFLLDEAAN
ncbi:type IV secretory system conjugative DNA transfer family protein, partial [Priestia aryabhattai]|uniref:type IV secretory system conjugative DNA transfer family protein n=1 Tax=Priestia aryabhattai TaxID=412384 RepID=UPI003D2BDC22